ncbi:hypothetical protein NL108_012841 [Boleophthalmus pectinirostris]|nr:hypothetical protein NL108_012841 [Boleophthalmus pectinirostris]
MAFVESMAELQQHLYLSARLLVLVRAPRSSSILDIPFDACALACVILVQPEELLRGAFIDSVDVELLDMGMWSLGLGAVGAAIAGILLANTDLCLPKVDKASVDYLGDADLRSTREDDHVIKANTLWEKSGAVVMALEERGVPLVAVVKEDIGTEIQDFRPHFAGDIYIDEKRHFYGPLQRRMGGLGFVRLGVWQNFIRAWRSGYQGNMNGEGFILGGVFVIGPGNQGILLEHREKEFGDKVDIADVLEAVQRIAPEK